MRRITRSFLIFTVLCSLILCTSCSLFDNDGSGHTFKISIDSNPENLDPQIASDASSIAVCRNTFTGLLRSTQGKLTLGVAKDYSISSDGLKYTFYLDERYEWKSVGNFSAKVTANDFVFAFKRLFDSKTESPHASKYFCISGARSAHLGVASLDEIGVKATNDYTLEFTLEYPNAEFLYLLAELPASPCNEEFFESCKGKYGLEAENIASNGAFYVRYWLYDKYNKSNYIRLSRNSSYSEISRVYPSGVTYFIDPKNGEKLNAFTAKTTDILVDKYDFSKLGESDYQRTQDYSGTLGIVFNLSNEIFARTDIRELFAMAVDRKELGKELPDNLTPAYSIFPPNTVICGSVYEGSFDKTVLEYNMITAEYRWNFILSDEEKDSLHGINILVCDEFKNSDKLRLISNSWYDAFGIHFGIEVVNKNDYDARLSAGDYDIAFVSLNTDSGDVFGYIKGFGYNADYNVRLSEVISVKATADKYSSLTAKYRDYLSAEKRIIEDYLFIPVCHSLTFCYFDEDVSDFEYDVLTDTIIFEKAKHY